MSGGSKCKCKYADINVSVSCKIARCGMYHLHVGSSSTSFCFPCIISISLDFFFFSSRLVDRNLWDTYVCLCRCDGRSG